MPYPPHSVKVETQVVDRIQDLRQHFVGCIKVTQIGPGVALTDPAGAVGVERAGILGITRLLDRNLAFGGKKQPVARCAGGEDAIHHVDAQAGVLDNFLGSAHTHEIARLIFGKVLQGGLDDLTGQFAWLAHAEAADGIAGETDFDGAFGRLFSKGAVHAALDDAK